MKILVTGSSGTIGTRLCEMLLARGEEVVGTDRKANAWNDKVDGVTVAADLLSSADMEQIPGDVGVVVHLAANARVYDLVADPARAHENILTVFNMVEWARKNGNPRFIFASSRECYGNIEASAYAEDMARIEHCESPYTASKFTGEALMHAYRRCYGLPGIILRFSNVYGRYDDSDRVVPLFIRKARRNESLTVFGEEKSLDFTYIDDTVNGIMLAIDRFDAAEGETINIASGTETSLVHCAERIKSLTGSTSGITIGKPRVGEVTRYRADLTKARTLLGYEPAFDFESGLRSAVEWYAAHT